MLAPPMALRKILFHPDPVLRAPTLPVERFDASLTQLLSDMAETMYAAPGIGLAAPQIGVSLRVYVIDVATGTDEPSAFRVFVNPEILERSGELHTPEGCLSLPGVRETVPRFSRVKVRAQNERGETFELEGGGALAHALQHEHDHIDGTLFVDHLSPLKRRVAMKSLKRA
jgi:peptide deformylase